MLELDIAPDKVIVQHNGVDGDRFKLQDRREGVWMHYRLAEDMTPELRAIVKSVGGMLDPSVLADLRARLDTSVCTSPDD